MNNSEVDVDVKVVGWYRAMVRSEMRGKEVLMLRGKGRRKGKD